MRIKEMRQNRQKARRRVRGQAVVEVALMAPWIFFLFVGVLDFGFYSYASITTQNAARVAAIANSFSTGAATNATATCNLVVAEMNSLPNTKNLVPGTYTCPAVGSVPTATSPISLFTLTTESESDGSTAAVVQVAYRMPTVGTTTPIAMIPIPGLVNGPVTIYRTAKVPILNSAPGG